MTFNSNQYSKPAYDQMMSQMGSQQPPSQMMQGQPMMDPMQMMPPQGMARGGQAPEPGSFHGRGLGGAGGNPDPKGQRQFMARGGRMRPGDRMGGKGGRRRPPQSGRRQQQMDQQMQQRNPRRMSQRMGQQMQDFNRSQQYAGPALGGGANLNNPLPGGMQGQMLDLYGKQNPMQLSGQRYTAEQSPFFTQPNQPDVTNFPMPQAPFDPNQLQDFGGAQFGDGSELSYGLQGVDGNMIPPQQGQPMDMQDFGRMQDYSSQQLDFYGQQQQPKPTYGQQQPQGLSGGMGDRSPYAPRPPGQSSAGKGGQGYGTPPQGGNKPPSSYGIPGGQSGGKGGGIR